MSALQFLLIIDLLTIACMRPTWATQVWLVSYPEEPQLKCLEKEDEANRDATSSTFSPGPELFHRTFPFHLVLDADLRVVQLGSGLRRMVPGLSPGVDVQEHLEVLCRLSRPCIDISTPLRTDGVYPSLSTDDHSLPWMELQGSFHWKASRLLRAEGPPEKDRVQGRDVRLG